jgi:hypothetical protein
MSGFCDWVSADVKDFWTEIAHTDHVLQLYENDGVFLDALTGFVLDAIHAHENAVVIATHAHLNSLERRLASYGYDIEALISDHQFIPHNAEDALSEFIINGLPDETLFKKAASRLFADARYKQRPVRVFGEGTALLWKAGFKRGAMKLEELWCEFQHQHPHSLFCAYSEDMFDDINSSALVCNVHTKMISGSEKQITRVLYRKI